MTQGTKQPQHTGKGTAKTARGTARHTRPEDSAWAVAVGQVASRAGQSQELDADFPAPSGIGDSIVGVSEGSSVHISGSFDSIADGLVLAGAVNAPLHAECTRCLTDIKRDWSFPVTAFFPYDSSKAQAQQARGNAKGEADIVAGEDESEDVYPLSPGEGFADLEALLRDTLVENLPLQPLCRPDCKGLCPQCGANLNEDPDHHHDETDDRFSALAGLKAELEREEGQQRTECGA